VLIVLLAALAIGDPEPSDLEYFEKEVRPILINRCQSCHGPEKQKGDLRLDSRAAVLKGGRTGPAVVPGRPEESVLVEAVNYGDLVQMPPKTKLPPKEIAALTKWVERGAAWPAEKGPKEALTSKIKPFDPKHWSFQPVRRVEPPAVHDAAWSKTPIDQFVLSALEAKKLKPAPPADKRTLLRRVTFDLIGLPATASEISAFLADDSPGAFAKVVDRLLASPQYGERWGRHWLDLVRYAETSGHEFDYDIPDAWQYRDYVVRAFNDDLPYDQFLSEHVAGDLIPNPRRNASDGTNESILATGFYFLGEGTHSPVDVRDDEIARIDNAIDVLSKTFLGLTVACARCHDHKFDAISTKDYYAFAGILKSSRFQHVIRDDPKATNEKLAALAAVKAEIGGPGVRVDESALAYVAAARRVIAYPSAEARGDVLFDDFEGERYVNWTSEGKAFGDGPIHLPVPSYQGDVACKGRGLVGSHNGRINGSVTNRDALTGVLTSREFTVDHNFIHFLIGGGSHKAKTCVDLLVDGKVVASLTGRDENRMRPASFDVRVHRGKHAHLRVVDDDSGGWGNISLDHVVFSSDEAAPGSPLRSAQAEAREKGLDPARLTRWVQLLSEPRTSLARPETEPSTLFENFDQGTFEGWTVSGRAFGDAPTKPGAFRVEESGSVPVSPGVAHSGLDSDRLAGVLRSRTFLIEQKFVHVLAWGQGGRINVVVDGFEKIRDPIYGPLLRGVDSEAPTWHTLDVSMWKGHRAYLEIGDGGTLDYSGARTRALPADGYLAVDEIRFSDAPAPAIASSLDQLDDALARWKSGQFGKHAEDANLSRILISRGLIERVRSVEPSMIARYRELESRFSPPVLAPAIIDGTGEDERVLIRGSAKTPGELVPRRFLEAFAGADQAPPKSGSGRLELARKMLDASCPLTVRVMVNRLWKGHFGTGLVKTPDDFGIMGEAPSHPDLLDWLASEFVARKWSIKAMHRMILLSSVYAMSSRIDPEAEVIDGPNRLLHRMNIRRLEAEAVRDSMLFISGRIDTKIGGPSVAPHLTALMDGRGRPDVSGPIDGNGRRSLYINVRRNFLSPMLTAFDFPAPATTMGRRNVSNVPAQALTMLNDPFVIDQAKRWADRLLAEPEATSALRVESAFVSAFGRPPTDSERAEAIAFVADGGGDAKAWADFCHVLFNAKEFLFIP